MTSLYEQDWAIWDDEGLFAKNMHSESEAAAFLERTFEDIPTYAELNPRVVRLCASHGFFPIDQCEDCAKKSEQVD